MEISGVDNAKFGPLAPRFPLNLIHPLGPLFRRLPLPVRRHVLFMHAARRIGNFRNPTTFTEKMQWRIINDRRPLLAWTTDKLAQKSYVNQLKAVHTELADLSVPETYWIGQHVDELRQLATNLPARFVIKPNHSSGRFLAINSDTAAVDWDAVERVVSSWVRRDEEELVLGHWPYGQARHLLIAEERIGSAATISSEMRGWVFDGVLRQLTRFDVGLRASATYNRTFNRIASSRTIEVPLDQNNHFDTLIPEAKERLVKMMEIIGEPFDHMRVDVFVEGSQFIFNELSPFAFGGLAHYPNPDFDTERGSFWSLPDLTADDPTASAWEALLKESPRGTRQASR